MAVLLVTALLSGNPAQANWPAFRGEGALPAFAGQLPERWSPDENIAWIVDLPGYGQSSPVVWGDRVYLTAVRGPKKDVCILVCLNGPDGVVRWSKAFAASQDGPNNPMMIRAASTPVVDGDGVIALYESGDLIALDHDGKVRWERSLIKDYGKIQNHHGLGSSLAQTAETVFVLVDHLGPSYLLAVDKRTGKTRWKADRPSVLSWTSPVVTECDGRAVVLASGGGRLDCHDAWRGDIHWSIDGISSNDIPSPSVSDGLVVLTGGINPLRPVKEGDVKANLVLRLHREGDRIAYNVVWSDSKCLVHQASPLIHRGLMYQVSRAGIVHCRDLATGKLCYSARLDGECWATPVAAGDMIYFLGKDGITTLLRAGETHERIASSWLWNENAFVEKKSLAKALPENQVKLPPSSPEVREQMEEMLVDAVGDVVYGFAISERSLIVRTGNRLYCIRDADSQR